MNIYAKKVIILIILLILLFLTGYFTKKNKTPTIPPVDKTQEITWQTYTNTKYKYKVSYPSTVRLSTGNVYASDLAVEDDIDFYNLAGVDVFVPIQDDIRFKKEALELFDLYKEVEKMNIKQYANKVWQMQIDDDNPFSNPVTSDLKEIKFKNRVAYSFTQNGGLTTLGGGYATPEDWIYTFIIVENTNKDKMVIRFLLNDMDADKMMESFSFSD